MASVRVIGVTGQQQQASRVSALELVLGGGGGRRRSDGGLTKPASSDPSPANSVPAQRVNIRAVISVFIVILSGI